MSFGLGTLTILDTFAERKRLSGGSPYIVDCLLQVCLTTALARRPAPDPRLLYPVLRALNPAPYAAWLSFGPQGPQVSTPP